MRIDPRRPIECGHCGTSLSFGSKFCWECGRPVDPEERERAAQSLDATLAEGQRLLGEGRAQEALMVAVSILEADGEHVPALVLRGDALERLGDLEGALEAYERIVDLKPESALDRLRLAQIRRAISNPLVTEPEGQGRRATAFAAVAAVVLVLSTASALVLAGRQAPAAPELPTVADSTVVPYQRAFATPVPTTQPAPVETPAVVRRGEAPPEESDDVPRAANPARREAPIRENVVTRPESARVAGSSLPDPRLGFEPVEPVVVVQERPSSPPPTGDPRPAAEAAERTAEPPSSRPSVIDVRPSRANETRGGSVPVDPRPEAAGSNEGEALVRTARQMALRGEYGQAAQLYERAIKLGVSPASANLRLARCYVSLGRKADAAAAYRRALDAYTKLQESGQGDPQVVAAGIAEARQALRILG